MVPTLSDGDYVLAFSFLSARVGDVIVFQGADQSTLIKRVTAWKGTGCDVAGDGRQSSMPEQIGLVSSERIQGRVVLKITPRGVSRAGLSMKSSDP